MSKSKQKTKKNKPGAADKPAQNQTASDLTNPLPEFPTLGHTLKVTKAKIIDKTCQSEHWIRVSPTFLQRIRRFLFTFAEAFGFALIAAIFLYLPDFFADYSHRDASFVRFFFGFVLSAIVIIGFFSAILTVIRDAVCYIETKQGRISYGSRWNKKQIDQSIAIRDIEILEILPPSSITKRARILTVHDHSETIIAETFGNDDDLKALYDWIATMRGRS